MGKRERNGISWSVLTLIAGLSLPAHAQMLPETEAFLRTIGIDPDAPAVVVVAHDRVNGVSLSSLAAAGDERGMRAFLATRKFLFDLRLNPGGPHAAPDREVFAPGTYMTREERNLAIRTFFNSAVP